MSKQSMLKNSGRWLIIVFTATILLMLLGACFTNPIIIGYGQGNKQPKGIIIKPSDELSIDVWTDKKAYRIGEYIQIHFSTNQRAYVYIWDIDTSGVVRRIFPNKYSGDNYLPAGKYTLPDRGYRFAVIPPTGTEYLQAIISTRKLDLTPKEFGQEFPILSRNPEEYSKKAKNKIQAIVPVKEWATDWTSFQVVAQVGYKPRAQFNYSPTLPDVGNVVTFDASSSYDPDGWIKSHRWDFNNDGRTDAYGKRVTHRFYRTGSRKVLLTVVDNHGLSDTTSKTVRVIRQVNRKPVAKFNYYPNNPKVGMRITFDASSTYDPDGYLTNFKWDFNHDGRFDAYGEEVSHSFQRPGSHPITLQVRDNQGLTDSITKWIEVSWSTNRPPVATFDYNPTHPSVGVQVSFDASSSYDPDGRITQHIWDFDQDGRADAYGRTVTHRFYSPNSFKVALTVIDNQGQSTSNKRWIQVSEPSPPVPPIPIGAGFWVKPVGSDKLSIIVRGKNWWFKDHSYKIKLETDGRFGSVNRTYQGPKPLGVVPVPVRNKLELSGSVRDNWVEYLITVKNANKIKFDLQMDIGGDGMMEQRTNFVYLGDRLKHPPSNPFVIKFPSGSLASFLSAKVCLSLIDHPAFHFMICFNWDEF